MIIMVLFYIGCICYMVIYIFGGNRMFFFICDYYDFILVFLRKIYFEGISEFESKDVWFMKENFIVYGFVWVVIDEVEGVLR